MARPPCGQEVLALAQQQLAKASDAHELRILQAVVLPLAYGLSIKETAAAVGRSPRGATAARNNYIRSLGALRKAGKQIRNRAHMSIADEAEFLVPFFEAARCGGMLVVSGIHRALEEHLGHSVALATAYNLLHRHGWRKLAPDKRHIDADVQAQEDWKKNCRSDLSKSKRSGKGRGRSG